LECTGRVDAPAWRAKFRRPALFAALPFAAVAQTAPAAEPVKLGIVSFLTGPAAGPFGIPSAATLRKS